MAKNDKDGTDAKAKKGARPDEPPVDLAARIGTRAPAEPVEPPPSVDPALAPQRLDGPLPSRRGERPTFIGMDEPTPSAGPERPARVAPEPNASDAAGEGAPKSLSGAIASRRTPPGPGEIDVVVTPLATPDDWHQFEIAFRRVRGITQLRPEYYRHGVAKMRVMWEGEGRLAQVLRAGIPGFRVRVIGEDRGTLQILVSQDNEERRPS